MHTSRLAVGAALVAVLTVGTTGAVTGIGDDCRSLEESEPRWPDRASYADDAAFDEAVKVFEAQYAAWSASVTDCEERCENLQTTEPIPPDRADYPDEDAFEAAMSDFNADFHRWTVALVDGGCEAHDPGAGKGTAPDQSQTTGGQQLPGGDVPPNPDSDQAQVIPGAGDASAAEAGADQESALDQSEATQAQAVEGGGDASPPDAGTTGGAQLTASGPMDVWISISTIGSWCSAKFRDPRPGVERFLGGSDDGTGLVSLTVDERGAEVSCVTTDGENDAAVGYTDECWLHTPEGDWAYGDGEVTSKDRALVDESGWRYGIVTMSCTFSPEDFQPRESLDPEAVVAPFVPGGSVLSAAIGQGGERASPSPSP